MQWMITHFIHTGMEPFMTENKADNWRCLKLGHASLCAAYRHQEACIVASHAGGELTAKVSL